MISENQKFIWVSCNPELDLIISLLWYSLLHKCLAPISEVSDRGTIVKKNQLYDLIFLHIILILFSNHQWFVLLKEYTTKIDLSYIRDRFWQSDNTIFLLLWFLVYASLSKNDRIYNTLWQVPSSKYLFVCYYF